MDYPRADILRQADAAIAAYGGARRAEVYFKFSCGTCGTRCAFAEPNRLWEVGECAACGAKTLVEQAGFSLILSTQGELPPKASPSSGEAS